jgi:2-hydroxy-3-oxopropionate reductase
LTYIHALEVERRMTDGVAPLQREGEQQKRQQQQKKKKKNNGRTTRSDGRRVGFIGLGIMGRPMALNLLKAGYALTVYNRTEASAEPLVAAGATLANSPRSVAEGCDVVITMVTDSEVVSDLVLGKNGVVEGAHRGMVLVDMSTISPRATKEIASQLAERGASMLDAPVSGGDKGAIAGTLTIMVGGPTSVFEESLPILAAMGKKIVHMGGTGAGQLAKLSNQILVAGNMVGLCECLLFAKRAGLDLAKLIDSLSAGAASSWALVNLGPKVMSRDFAPGFRVKLLEKDLGYVVSTAEELGAAVPATVLVRDLYRRLEEEGLGDAGTQALIMALERTSEEMLAHTEGSS